MRESSMRETKAVADLIPGDMIVPEGWEVLRYPYGTRALPGTVVYVDKGAGIEIGQYYNDPETQVSII